MATPTREKLLTSVKELLDSGKYSDLTITCGDEKHKVHKAIVCSRCDFFERAERFPAGREAAEDVINLPEDEPKIIALLLEFLYTGEYTPKLPPPSNTNFPHTCERGCRKELCDHHKCDYACFQTCRGFSCGQCIATEAQCASEMPKEDESHLLLHSKLYSLADKYDVPDLQDLAKLKFKRACKAFWSAAIFGDVAEHVFTSTPDEDLGLRSIVHKTLAGNRLGLITQPGVQTFLMKRPEMMLELLKKK